MPQDDNLIYRKNLSEERIQEIQKETAAYRYGRNRVTAAFVGAGIAILIALLLGISFGIPCLVVAGFGAAAGYAFYVWGKYLEEKHKNDPSSE